MYSPGKTSGDGGKGHAFYLKWHNMNEYFIKNQKEILWLANTEAGRFLLGLKESFPIIRIVPNGYTVQLDKKTMLHRFYVVNKSAEIFVPLIEKLLIVQDFSIHSVLHHSGLEIQRNKYPTIYLATPYYASGNGVDSIGKADNNVWATTRDAVTGQYTRGVAAADLYLQGGLVGANYQVERIAYPIDTSMIIDATLIISATFYATVKSVSGANGIDAAALIQTSAASPTAIVTADYDQFGTTEGSATRANCTTTGLKSWVLNATGIGWISDTTYSLFGLRDYTKDIANVAPTTDRQNSFWGTSDNTKYAYVDVVEPIKADIIVPQSSTSIGRRYRVVGY